MNLIDTIKRCNGYIENIPDTYNIISGTVNTFNNIIDENISDTFNSTILNIVNEKIQSEILKLQIINTDGTIIPPIGPRLKAGILSKEDAEFEKERLKKFLLLNQHNIIVIGNGGAGKIGLIKDLALKYNSEVSESEKLIVIWRAAHSFQNFEGLDYIDAAVTYEPHFELNLFFKNLISYPKLLFLNHFELSCGANDILQVKNWIKQEGEWVGKGSNVKFLSTYRDLPELEDNADVKKHPILVMVYIILATFYKVYNVELDDWHEFKIIYASRYNHSAMGEKDETLFREALRQIYYVLKDNARAKTAGRPHDEIICRIWEKLYLYDKPPGFNDAEWDRLNYSKLYEAWMKHVDRKTVDFPWDILDFAFQNNYYHLNDKAFYIEKIEDSRLGFTFDNLLTTIDPNKFSNILINPGILWSVNGKVNQNSNQDKFLEAITSREYQHYIRQWIPEERYRIPIIDWNKRAFGIDVYNRNPINGLFTLPSYVPDFKKIYKEYTNHLHWRNEWNENLEKRWYDWNPPQDLSNFINIGEQRKLLL